MSNRSMYWPTYLSVPVNYTPATPPAYFTGYWLNSMGLALSNSNRTLSGTLNTSNWCTAYIRSSSTRTGKYYYEVKNEGSTLKNVLMGFIRQSNWVIGTPSHYNSNYYNAGFYCVHSGNVGGGNTGVITNGSLSVNAAYDWSTINDIMCCAVDFDSGKVWYRKNGGSWISGGDPVTGTSPTYTLPSGAYDPSIGLYGLSTNTFSLTANFTPSEWAYTPPTGYNNYFTS
jgi:hypothetical protein